MTKKNFAFFLIQLALVILPAFLWKYISNPELKFSIVLFLLFFCGYAFFRDFEKILRPEWQKDELYYNKWWGLLLQMVMLFMFYSYSVRILEIIRNN